MQSHKKPSSIEFLIKNTFKFSRSIRIDSALFFSFNSQGKSPYKIDWDVDNWQKEDPHDMVMKLDAM